MHAILNAEVGHKISMKTTTGDKVGTVCFIMKAGETYDKSIIEKYYGLTKFSNSLCKAHPVDRIVLEKLDNSYIILPRTPKIFRWVISAIKEIT